MSILSESLGIGFAALRTVSGETLSFRGVDMLCVVNKAAEGEPGADLDPKREQQSAVELECDLVDEVPRAGESFEDEDGNLHVIRFVENRGNTYFCKCIFRPAA
jgi:hypothetical protein